MGRNQPTRRVRYGTPPADKEGRLLDVSGRAEASLRLPASPRIQALTSAGLLARRRAHRPATLLTRHYRYSLPGSNIERHARLACLAGTSIGVSPRGIGRPAILNIGCGPPVSALQKPRQFVGVSLQ
ncbi:hypothetical protein OH76DRAFT_1013430 [Lentinus brumalis]|uniref:Uncharacterized protein n=1 Tax=Lentinus brumalis TaxID=2498619 RepID=A0A371CYF0_9APHY|nr:hypothetical protein OH76DRAFT_1013430 [Polyporus brumalis]